MTTSKYNHLLNKRYGKVVALARERGCCKNGANILCRCDCGREFYIKPYLLKHNKVYSCGCARYDKKRFRYKDRSVPAQNALLSRYKNGAKQRNLEWSLSKKYFLKLTTLPCHYCGSKPDRIITSKGSNSIYVYNGIDRMDNDLGYTVDNCVTCCAICNRAKRAISYKEFMNWIEKLKEIK